MIEAGELALYEVVWDMDSYEDIARDVFMRMSLASREAKR